MAISINQIMQQNILGPELLQFPLIELGFHITGPSFGILFKYKGSGPGAKTNPPDLYLI